MRLKVALRLKPLDELASQRITAMIKTPEPYIDQNFHTRSIEVQIDATILRAEADRLKGGGFRPGDGN